MVFVKLQLTTTTIRLVLQNISLKEPIDLFTTKFHSKNLYNPGQAYHCLDSLQMI